MAVDFGSFINGMRLSASDIADRQKALLNERYMNSQMETMDLSRRMNEDELGYRPVQRGMDAERFGNEMYNADTARELPAVTAFAASEEAAPDIVGTFNAAIPTVEAARAKRKKEPFMYTGASYEKGQDGQPTGRILFRTRDGNTVAAKDASEATEIAARALGAASAIPTGKNRRAQVAAAGSRAAPKYSPTYIGLQKTRENARNRIVDIHKQVAANLMDAATASALTKQMQGVIDDADGRIAHLEDTGQNVFDPGAAVDWTGYGEGAPAPQPGRPDAADMGPQPGDQARLPSGETGGVYKKGNVLYAKPYGGTREFLWDRKRSTWVPADGKPVTAAKKPSGAVPSRASEKPAAAANNYGVPKPY